MAAVVQKIPPKKKKEKNKVWFWANECKYEVILDNVKNRKWKLIQDEKFEAKSNMYWIDVATIHERFRTIQPWQTINHFPGMPNIARKNRMGQNLNRMQKLFPREYSFYPRTWVLPGELNDFRAQFDNQGNALGNKIFIIKPDTGCQGKGIFLTRTFDNIPQHDNVVAQVYIKKPLLLDGYKFDLRIYCLVSSVKPLRMYLFQDGLVRMCTEEYTKPTKQNLSMVCMHLTNYAVNKFNSNFQQPSAKSSEETAQDEVGKRSLHWFMNYIKDEHGEAKAGWLWKRIGTLCVRTVLSIMPTLSREYDQHFKSFVGIPFKSVAPKVPAYGNNNNGEKRPRGESLGEENDAVDEDDDDDDGDDDDDADDDEQEDNNDANEDGNKSDEDEPEDKDANAAGATAEGVATDGNVNGATTTKKKKKKIQFRGSRCFEVLGFDIMLDSNLKPWLIEVNHLPSFGTDSPLDQDIKDRLMAQVLASVPVLADDEQAYNAYHKQEATRRLLAKREADKAAAVAAAAAAAAAKPKPRRPLPLANANQSTNPTASESMKMPSITNNNNNNNQSTEAETAVIDKVEDDADDDIDAEVTPERLQEIKDQLVVIYEVHSPEKIAKIDRLLAKYAHREEEFLRFVHLKYGLPPPFTKKQREREEREREKQRLRQIEEEAAAIAAAAAAAEEAAMAASIGNSQPQESEDVSDASNMGIVDGELQSGEGKPGREIQRKQRVVSRSLSPTPTNGRKPAWKGNVEDDAAFRTEVMVAHIPQENDEWMLREMKRLPQFTRIFPPEVSASSARNGAGDKEEDEENGSGDDEVDKDDGAEGIVVAPTSAGDASTSTKPVSNKVASYEEILFQVFIQDKRQTMRLRCPLPSRARSGPGSDTASLPPLDSRSSSQSSFSSKSSSSKGMGWRAPPPKQEKKEVAKVVTQSQLESAKRLSQGLSVAQVQSQTTRNKYVTSNPAAVLIMDEYDSNLPPNQQQLTSTGNIWLQTRLQNVRMAQNANMRAGRGISGRVVVAATPASVLRQQVFHFGSEVPANLSENSTTVASTTGIPSVGVGYPGPISEQVSNQGSIVGRTSSMNAVSSGGSVSGNSAYGYIANNNSVSGISANRFQQYQQQLQQSHQPQQLPMQSGASNYLSRHADNEEMLRQLFPGWF